jgi:hypothetical protein
LIKQDLDQRKDQLMNVYFLDAEGEFVLLSHDKNILTPEFRKLIEKIRKEIPKDIYHLNGRICKNSEFYNYLQDKLKEYGFKIVKPKYASL